MTLPLATAIGFAMLCSLCLLTTACEAEAERPFIRPIKPFGQDMRGAGGVDLGHGDMGQAPSPQCEGQFEGAQCDLPAATGVCLGGACQLLGCLEGFGSCDGQGGNGCETAFSVDEHCGGCDIQCGPQESCQLSGVGHVCGVGVVCQAGSYDLDQRLDNGCEWQELEVTQSPLKPFQYFSRIDRVFASPQVHLAAGGLKEGDDFARQVITSRDPEGAPPATLKTPGQAQARRILVLPGQNQSVILWPDLLSVHSFSGGEPAEITQMCQPVEGRDPWSWEGMSAWRGPGPAWLVAGEHTLMPVNACESLDVEGCFWRAAQFSQADYVRHFYPYPAPRVGVFAQAGGPAAAFDPEEVASCVPCAFDAVTGALTEPLACEDVRQCRAPEFVSQDVCMGCTGQAGGCPSFEPRDLAQSQVHQGRVYVITARGVVALELDAIKGRWSALGRWEQAFDPGVIGGKAIVAGAVGHSGQQERVFLLGSDRQVVAYDVVEAAGVVRFVPTVPGGVIEMRRPAQGAFKALDAWTVAWSDQEGMGWMDFTPRGPRRVLLPKGRDPDGAFFGLDASSGQFSLLELEFGNLSQRVVVRKK